MRKLKVNDASLLPLIYTVYSAAEDPTRWPALLEELAGIIGASAGTFDAYNTSRREGSVSAAFNLSPEFLHQYATHFAPQNPWLADDPQPGHTLTGQMLVPDDVLLRLEFYQDFLRHEDVFHLVGARLLARGEMASQITLLRPRGKGTFGVDVISFLDRIVPHLEQAMRIHQRISEANIGYRSLMEIIDRITIGVFLVTSTGRVAAMNRAGAEIVEACDGLLVRRGILEAARSNENTILKRFISASTMTIEKNSYPGGTLLVSRKSLHRPFMALVAPSQATSDLMQANKALAVVFVSDPEAPPITSHLRQFFQLTATEARVAKLLLQGKTPDEISDHLHITINTTRTHLKRVFFKTGVGRQADLTRLLASGVTGLRSPS